MSKLFLVTNDGDYEWALHQICSTKEKAEETAKRYPTSVVVEEWVLDQIDSWPEGEFAWSVSMTRDGTLVYPIRLTHPEDLRFCTIYREQEHANRPSMVRFELWAKDKHEAETKSLQLLEKIKPYWTEPFAPRSLTLTKEQIHADENDHKEKDDHQKENREEADCSQDTP